MQKIKDFLQAVSELQQEYGIYITTEMEEQIILSVDENANVQNILCYTGHITPQPFDEDRAEVDPYNISIIEDDEDE